MSFSATLSGFQTKEQAKKFLDWFEGQGEQDDTIPMWMDGNVTLQCDVKTGMIEHENGWEYKLDIFSHEDE